MNLIPARKLALPVALATAFVTASAVRPQSAAGASAKPAETVHVLREVPRVERPPAMPRFSAAPSSEEIRKARVFGEPIVAVGGEPDSAENQALARAVLHRLEAKGGRDADPVRAHLDRHPDSPYRASLLLNLAMNDRREGAFTRAIASLEEAWRLTKSLTDPDGRAIAERAIAELGDIYLRFGSMEGLAFVMSAIEGRNFSGASAQKLSLASEGYSLLVRHHEDAIPSARTALQRFLRAAKGPDYVWNSRLDEFPATHSGANLLQVRELSRQIGEPLRILRHDGGEIPVPSIVHLRIGHYSAVVREENGRYLIDDPCLGGELWVTREVLLAESSGYFFVAETANPTGFKPAEEQAAALLRGKCYPIVPDPNGPKPGDPEASSCDREGPAMGLARWSVNKLHASLHLEDTPLGYAPPLGPQVQLRLDYHHREKNQPAIFSFSNIGPLWSHRWLAYLEDDPTNPAASVAHYQPGGGVERWFGYDAGTGAYAIDRETRAQLVRVSASPVRYERRLPDGSLEVFEQADGAATSPRRVFRTAVVDPQGNSLTFTYDSSLRLVALTDAIGQVTTLAYEHADPLKITKITDPFGRFAQLTYDASGRLQKITDVIGLESEFSYTATGMIVALETPYGRTDFSTDPYLHTSDDQDFDWRWVEVVDPLGGKERIEYRYTTTAIPSTESIVPFGFATRNVEMHYRNTFYWDKRAMSLFPGDPTKAEITKWLMAPLNGFTTFSPVAVPHSTKKPLENRVWYAYPNQTDLRRIGSHTSPAKIARVLEDSQTQVYTYDYNSLGRLVLAIDPLGRATRYEYSEDGMDLLAVYQLLEDGSYGLITSNTYNQLHQLVSSRDPAGQTTYYSYLPDGRLLTRVTPERDNLTLGERTTSYSYHPESHPTSPYRLASITSPSIGGLAGPVSTYSYDVFGRVQSVGSSSAGTLMSFQYDLMDRPTKTTFPDGSFVEKKYHRLDASATRDRAGRWTSASLDSLRRVTSITDPTGATAHQQWCECGSVEKVVDALGNATRWERDLQGRVTEEIWADGRLRSFVYESATSRLHAVTDPKLQRTEFDYDVDDMLIGIRYLNEQVPTPDVTLSYRIGGQPRTGAPEPFGLLTRRSDGVGATSYSYYALGELGALSLRTIDGPFAEDLIEYGYDEMGRVRSRKISSATENLWSFDSLGRTVSEINALGTFEIKYAEESDNVESVDYPNGQEILFEYAGPAEGSALQAITNMWSPTETTISRYDLAWGPGGVLNTLRDSAQDGVSTTTHYLHDPLGRLTSATRFDDLAPGEPLERYQYLYDLAGNRVAEQVGDTGVLSVFNSVNELVAQQEGGRIFVKGVTNETALVWIDGTQALTNAIGEFESWTAPDSGSGGFDIVATDPSGNLRSSLYAVEQPGALRNLAYDANGNLIDDGERQYEWDAENRLVTVVTGQRRSEFVYDGSGTRVRSRELLAGVVVADVWSVWCGYQLCADLNASMEISREYSAYGYREAGESIYFHRDHLGTVRELVDEFGSVRGRFKYDPFGRRAQISGDLDSTIGFTGHFYDGASELHLAPFRAYASSLGRWISRDPLSDSWFKFADVGAGASPNLRASGLGLLNHYPYVDNGPDYRFDPLGLEVCPGYWLQWSVKIIKTGPRPPASQKPPKLQEANPYLPRGAGHNPFPGRKPGSSPWGIPPVFPCICYWQCIPCEGGIVYDPRELASTWGKVVHAGRSITSGDACNCLEPGPATRCPSPPQFGCTGTEPIVSPLFGTVSGGSGSGI